MRRFKGSFWSTSTKKYLIWMAPFPSFTIKWPLSLSSANNPNGTPQGTQRDHAQKSKARTADFRTTVVNISNSFHFINLSRNIHKCFRNKGHVMFTKSQNCIKNHQKTQLQKILRLTQVLFYKRKNSHKLFINISFKEFDLMAKKSAVFL